MGEALLTFNIWFEVIKYILVVAYELNFIFIERAVHPIEWNEIKFLGNTMFSDTGMDSLTHIYSLFFVRNSRGSHSLSVP